MLLYLGGAHARASPGQGRAGTARGRKKLIEGEIHQIFFLQDKLLLKEYADWHRSLTGHCMGYGSSFKLHNIEHRVFWG